MYTNLLTNSIEVLKFLVIFNLIFHRRIKEKTGKYTGLIVLVGLLVLMSYVLHSDDQIVAIIVFGVEFIFDLFRYSMEQNSPIFDYDCGNELFRFVAIGNRIICN